MAGPTRQSLNTALISHYLAPKVSELRRQLSEAAARAEREGAARSATGKDASRDQLMKVCLHVPRSRRVVATGVVFVNWCLCCVCNNWCAALLVWPL